MTEKIDSNNSEYCNNELSQDESKDLDSCNKTLINDELRSMLLEAADDFDSYALEAVKNGKMSLDEYHQIGGLAMLLSRDKAEESIDGHNPTFAFAFALRAVRACGNEIKLGIKHNDLAHCFNMLRVGNVCLGVAERIEVDQTLTQQKAKKAAHARHSKNDVHKQLVWDYYQQDRHSFMSRDQAAEKIRSKYGIPFTYRTVRKWIDEFHKLQKNYPLHTRV